MALRGFLILKLNFMENIEIWKDIKGYEEIYQVSNFGKVIRCNKFCKKNLKPILNSVGYYTVHLSKNNISKKRSIHQLVAEAFLNHIPSGYKLVINHKDFNKLNNCVENLEIVTARENSNRKHIKSSSKYVGVSFHKLSKKWSAYIFNKKMIYLGLFNTEIEANNTYQNKLKEIENGL